MKKVGSVRHFTFALARELGMTRAQLVEQITHEELEEWSQFFKMESDELKKQTKAAAPGPTRARPKR